MAKKITESVIIDENIEKKITFEELEQKFLALDTENFKLAEALNSVSLMIDNQGWTSMATPSSDSGLSLTDVKRASAQLRELSVGNPLVKRGYKLRSSYVWSRGFTHSKVSSRVRNTMFSAVNERCLFSDAAHEELELAAYTDGNIFVLGRLSDKQFSRVPISEISGVMTDPDNNEVIWAVRRSWTRTNTSGNVESVVRWYYTDTYPEDQAKARTFKTSAGSEPVDMTHIMFPQTFNSHVGWTFGVPDALPIMAWSRLYREFLENGTIMTKALAQFAYKISAKSRAGVSGAAAKVATPDGQSGRVGATAAMGADVDLMPMPKAGNAYDFEAGRSIAAMIAAGLEVSIVALLADPGQSGAYGTAQTLDTPTMKAMQARQNIWTLFYKRLMRFIGATNVEITWPSIEVEPTHRMVQALAMAWESGILTPEQYHSAIIDILDISNNGEGAPKGVMLPNNAGYPETTSNDANPDGGIVPGQGQSGSVGSLSY